MQNLKELSTFLHLKGEQRNRKIDAMIAPISDEIKRLENIPLLRFIQEIDRNQENAISKCFARQFVLGNISCKKSDDCIRALKMDFRFKSLNLLNEIHDQLIKTDAYDSTKSRQPDSRSTIPTESQDPMIDNFDLLAKNYIEKIQKEQEMLKESKPQLWIAAVSFLSPLIFQMLGSWLTNMGLSSQPENLFSGLSQMLAGNLGGPW